MKDRLPWGREKVLFVGGRTGGGKKGVIKRTSKGEFQYRSTSGEIV